MDIRDYFRLRNLTNDLILIEYGQSTFLDIFGLDEDEQTISSSKYEVYADPANNNLIVAIFFGCEDEPLPDDALSSVSGGISYEAYDYIINALNTNENTLVFWSQTSGTTSDYTIYYDVVDDCWKNLSDIYGLMVTDDEMSHRKYLEVRNGKTYTPDFGNC